MRQSLYARLWELQIFQKVNQENFHLLHKYHRRASRSQSDEFIYYGDSGFDDPFSMAIRQRLPFCEGNLISVIQHPGKVCRNHVYLPYEDARDKYVKFITHICQFYKELCSPNVEQLESLCKELLKPSQPNSEATQYNIHKSLFEKRVLKDSIIRVK